MEHGDVGGEFRHSARFDECVRGAVLTGRQVNAEVRHRNREHGVRARTPEGARSAVRPQQHGVVGRRTCPPCRGARGRWCRARCPPGRARQATGPSCRTRAGRRARASCRGRASACDTVRFALSVCHSPLPCIQGSPRRAWRHAQRPDPLQQNNILNSAHSVSPPLASRERSSTVMRTPSRCAQMRAARDPPPKCPTDFAPIRRSAPGASAPEPP